MKFISGLISGLNLEFITGEFEMSWLAKSEIHPGATQVRPVTTLIRAPRTNTPNFFALVRTFRNPFGAEGGEGKRGWREIDPHWFKIFNFIFGKFP